MFQKLAYLIAAALLKATIAWLKDPKNRDDIETAGSFIAGKVVAATPWKWDDKLPPLLADLPSLMSNLSVLPTQVADEISKLFGGKR